MSKLSMAVKTDCKYYKARGCALAVTVGLGVNGFIGKNLVICDVPWPGQAQRSLIKTSACWRTSLVTLRDYKNTFFRRTQTYKMTSALSSKSAAKLKGTLTRPTNFQWDKSRSKEPQSSFSSMPNSVPLCIRVNLYKWYFIPKGGFFGVLAYIPVLSAHEKSCR